MTRTCSVEGCNRKRYCRGYCTLHYQRVMIHGSIHLTIRPHVCGADGCENARVRGDYCGLHYRRFKKHGTPNGGRKTYNGDPQKWLLAHLDYDGEECLIWPFARHVFGYGFIRIDGKTECVHTIITTINLGAKPSEEYEVRHLCGNGHLGCVNPQHLLWGTSKENGADLIIHGTSPRGERHWKTKLAHEDVIEIVSDSRPYKEIASQYGTTDGNIGCIKRGVNWSWLTGINPNTTA